MTRKISSIVVAMLCIVGLAVAVAGPASARSVLPHQGSYTGYDHAYRSVRFTFSGNEVTHFYVHGQSFGNAHVSNGMWHERCNNGWCFRGEWLTDTHVVGAWRRGGDSYWSPWSADIPAVRPFVGRYSGFDHGGATVRVTFSGTHVHSFTVNGYGDFPATSVSNGMWHEVCSANWCYKGHWEDDYRLVGEWRTPGSAWHPWEVQALSS